MPTTMKKLPITERALIQRANRALKSRSGNWESLRKMRGRAAEAGKYGHYQGQMWSFFDDLQGFARKLGVLSDLEALEK